VWQLGLAPCSVLTLYVLYRSLLSPLPLPLRRTPLLLSTSWPSTIAIRVDKLNEISLLSVPLNQDIPALPSFMPIS
jgi:hypothetical protein